jgi:hypothetical protein
LFYLQLKDNYEVKRKRPSDQHRHANDFPLKRQKTDEIVVFERFNHQNFGAQSSIPTDPSQFPGYRYDLEKIK